MTDELDLTKAPALFTSLESTFLKIGFSKEQVVTMNITAGAYVVTNPSDDLPRIICSIDGQNNFKMEYSHILETTLDKLSLVLSELSSHDLTFQEGELVDESSGSILDDFNNIPNSLSHYSQFFKRTITKHNKFLNSLKIYLTFQYIEGSISGSKKTLHKKTNQAANIKKKDQENEQSIILEFISQRTTKSVQSRHLLELFPNASKTECLTKLKEIADQGYIKQSGSWFKLK